MDLEAKGSTEALQAEQSEQCSLFRLQLTIIFILDELFGLYTVKPENSSKYPSPFIRGQGDVIKCIVLSSDQNIQFAIMLRKSRSSTFLHLGSLEVFVSFYFN